MLLLYSFLCCAPLILSEDAPCPRGQVRRCRNNKLPTCEDWFLPEVKDVPENCVRTCECREEDHVYSHQIRKCVPAYKCRKLLQETACLFDDPNGVHSPCLPSRCDEDGVCTRDCKKYCVCREGYMINKWNNKCLQVPTPL